MLTNKGYYIPKYLYKRKILLIKEKIIKRKYGYLFFRKAVSNVLPSQAEHHYEQHMKKKIMQAWIVVWYEERIEWRFIIKANVHYQCNVLQKSLQKWKCYLVNKRFSKLKNQIAVIHSIKISIKQTLLWALNKWKMYHRIRVEKKVKKCIAKKFFQSKNHSGVLRNYFKRWLILKLASVKNKLQMQKAIKSYEYHLIYVSFKKIGNFKNIQKHKYESQKKYIAIYEQTLLRRLIAMWKKFVIFNQQVKSNYILSTTHYVFKLKYNTLQSIIRFKNVSKKIKEIINNFRQSQNQRLLKKYLFEWKLLKDNKMLKLKKIIRAKDFYFRRLSQKVIYKFIRYVNYRKNKTIIMTERVAKAKIYLKSTKLRFLLLTWKGYCTSRILKKHKYLVANQYAEKNVLRIYMKVWQNFWLFRKFRQAQIIEISAFHNLKSIKKYFQTWKSHIKEILCFKHMYETAIDLHKRQIIQEGLLLIVRSGLVQKDENYRKTQQIFNRHLFLSYKYFSLWRRKVLTFYVLQNFTSENSYPCSTGTLDWHPICFLAPRISL